MRKLCLIFVVLLSVLSPLYSSQGFQSQESPDILLLFSYHPGHTWEDSVYLEMLKGINNTLPAASITLEYMDSKRNSPEKVEEDVYSQLSSYDSRRFSLIVAVDDNALQFLAGRGRNLFPEASIVFCGVNDYGLVKDSLRTRHTGVVSRVNLADTLALAMKLIPDLKKVYVIVDATPTGAGNKNMVLEQKKELRGELKRLEFSFLGENLLTTEELVSRSSALEDDSILLLTSWYRDKEGRFISESEFLGLLGEAASVPVFNLLHLRPGILGGKVTSGTVQADIAVDQIRSIASGTPAGSIPVVSGDTTVYAIDQQRLRKWGFKENRLPKDYIPLNSLELSTYRITIQILTLSLLILLLLISLLIRQTWLLNRSSLDLSRQKNELYTTLSSIGDGVISTDTDARIVFMNTMAQSMTGWSLKEAEGLPVSRVFVLENSRTGEAVNGPVEKVLELNRRVFLDPGTQLVNKNGDRLSISDSASPIRDPRAGTMLGAIVVFRDITESERIQQTLQNEQRRLRDAQAMALVGNWEYDPAEDSYWYSREVYSLTSTTRNESGDSSTLDFMAKLFPSWIRGSELPVELAEKQSRIKSIMAVTGNDGIDQILHLVARRVVNPETGREIVAGIIQDFSELSQTRAALKASQDQLRQAARMEAVGKLAGGISHEFNNLLQIILGYSQLLKDEFEGEKEMEYLEPILKTAASARNLTRQLLLFSRTENMNFQDFSLSSLIHSLIPILGRLLEENIFLESELEGHDDWVHADKHQIEQVLINLCLNSRDAMTAGGRIVIRQSILSAPYSFPGLEGFIPAGDYVELTVQDNGSGINKDILPEIFDPFFTTKSRDKGTGLGLSIVYGIIRQHQGYLNIETGSDRGTTFHIYLPRISSSEEERNETEQRYPEISPVKGFVYMAEDDPMVRQLSETMLRKSGFETRSFVNGKELVDALEKKKDDEIGLFLLDVIMPEMGGVQAFNIIRSMGYDRPVLFMSGYTEDRLQNLSDLQNTALIHKPFTMKDLIGKIRELM